MTAKRPKVRRGWEVVDHMARVRSVIDALDLPKTERAALAVMGVALDHMQDAGFSPLETVQAVNALLRDAFDAERAARRQEKP